MVVFLSPSILSVIYSYFPFFVIAFFLTFIHPSRFSLSLRPSSSSGSSSSQSLHVWLSQRHLLHAALPAVGSGQDAAADPAEQCQAGVCTHCADTYFIKYMHMEPPALSLFPPLHVLSLTLEHAACMIR